MSHTTNQYINVTRYVVFTLTAVNIYNIAVTLVLIGAALHYGAGKMRELGGKEFSGITDPFPCQTPSALLLDLCAEGCSVLDRLTHWTHAIPLLQVIGLYFNVQRAPGVSMVQKNMNNYG